MHLTLKTLFSYHFANPCSKSNPSESWYNNLKKLTCASLLLMFLPALKDLSQLPINYSKRENFIHAKKHCHNLDLYLCYKKLDKINCSLNRVNNLTVHLVTNPLTILATISPK